MEKTCSEKKGHPPNTANFKERLYERKRWLLYQANSAHACLTCDQAIFFFWRRLMHALNGDFKIQRRNENENVA